jgi:spore maturation protein CgeB
MRALGYSPSVRLFEAGACGATIVSDSWPGLDTVFALGEEIVLTESCADVLRVLDETSDQERAAIGAAARRRVLAEHTADRRVDRLHELMAGAIAR